MIPKIIHQVWVGTLNMPQREKDLCQKIQDIHPDYAYKFWTSDNVGPELESMPANVRDCYTEYYKQGDYVFACDILRIWLVYKYGGFYLDVDFDIKNCLDHFLDFDGVFFFHGLLDGEAKDLTMPNGVFFGKTGSEPLKHCLDSVHGAHWLGPSWFGETIKSYYSLPNEATHQTVSDAMAEDEVLYYNFAEFETWFARHLALASWFPDVREKLEGNFEVAKDHIDCEEWEQHFKSQGNRNKMLKLIDRPRHRKEHWARLHKEMRHDYGDTFVGFGSYPSYVQGEGTLLFLSETFEMISAKSILDAGCGYFHNIMANMDLEGISYSGVDIEEKVIERNRGDYPHHHFNVLDLVDSVPPKADVVVCRDFFFHMYNADAKKVLNNLKESGSSYLIATYHPTEDFNFSNLEAGYLDADEVSWGESSPVMTTFRLINLEGEPFNLGKPIASHREESSHRSIGVWKIN